VSFLTPTEGGKDFNPSDLNFFSKKGDPPSISYGSLPFSYLLESHTPKKAAEIQTTAMDDSKQVYL